MNTRLVSIGATLALAAGLLAAPASAAGTTRYVDDDGTAGAAGCNGAVSVPATVQAGLDATSAGDTVLVCPGTYPELVTIATPGVTLRAAQPYKAKIAPTSPAGGAIVRVAAKNVTVQWLRIIAPTTGSCTTTGKGIQVDGVKKARIISNRIVADPNGDTYQGACGLTEGIAIDDGSSAAVVNHNIVRAFTLVGIIVHNADAQVVNNSVQYWHDVNVCFGVRPACRKSPSPAQPVIPTGIRFFQSTGSADLNGISSAQEGQTAQTYLVQGISTAGVDGLRIRKNDIRLVEYGMWLETSDNLKVVGNVVVGHYLPQQGAASKRVGPASQSPSGILAVSGNGSLIKGNHVLHNMLGADVWTTTTGATITGNDFTGNTTYDCLTSDTDPANIWTDNLGNNDYPVALCTDAPIQSVPGSPT